MIVQARHRKHSSNQRWCSSACDGPFAHLTLPHVIILTSQVRRREKYDEDMHLVVQKVINAIMIGDMLWVMFGLQRVTVRWNSGGRQGLRAGGKA